MLALFALVACLATEPKCAAVRTYDTRDACETAMATLPPISWLPMHCEERPRDAQT